MIEKYIKLFKKLRSDASRDRWSSATLHRAPHKPLLLLAIIDLFEQGSIKANLIELNSDLGELFTVYWSRVMPPDHGGNIALPFFHLKSEGFWELVPHPGKENFLSTVHQIRSINQLLDTVIGAKLDEELYELLCAEKSRNLLRTTLIEQYFAPKLQLVLAEQSFTNVQAYHYSQKLLEDARKEQETKEVLPEKPYQSDIRDQGFRRAIVTAYNHRCALCGIRMLTPEGHTVVEAAHIIPWSTSHNDNPRNGIALCKLCHWSFDEGLLSISPDYKVLTSRQIAIDRNIPGHIVTLEGRGIIGPLEKILWPDIDFLKWHRRNIFHKY